MILKFYRYVSKEIKELPIEVAHRPLQEAIFQVILDHIEEMEGDLSMAHLDALDYLKDHFGEVKVIENGNTVGFDSNRAELYFRINDEGKILVLERGNLE